MKRLLVVPVTGHTDWTWILPPDWSAMYTITEERTGERPPRRCCRDGLQPGAEGGAEGAGKAGRGVGGGDTLALSCSQSCPRNRVPLRALVLSLGALLVPFVARWAFPDQIRQQEPLLWLLAIVPAFLLAYYRGARGAATAMAAAMAVLALSQALAAGMGRPILEWPLAVGVMLTFAVLAAAVAWLAERLKQERSAAERLALTDPLTGLPNRRFLDLFLERQFAAAERGSPLAVVMMDLDGFKDYNDRNGHAAGDTALRAVADVLESNSRRMDVTVRYGGEEFLALLAACDAEGARAFAERIRTALARADLAGGPVTMSAGVAAVHPGIRSPADLIAAADLALYEAKRAGGNRVRAAATAQPGPFAQWA